jgi:hypothetical protein
MWESNNEECLLAKQQLTNFKNTLASAEKRVSNGHGKLALLDIQTCFDMDPKLTAFHTKLYLLQCNAHLKVGLVFSRSPFFSFA